MARPLGFPPCLCLRLAGWRRESAHVHHVMADASQRLQVVNSRNETSFYTHTVFEDGEWCAAHNGTTAG